MATGVLKKCTMSIIPVYLISVNVTAAATLLIKAMNVKRVKRPAVVVLVVHLYGDAPDQPLLQHVQAA